MTYIELRNWALEIINYQMPPRDEYLSSEKYYQRCANQRMNRVLEEQIANKIEAEKYFRERNTEKGLLNPNWTWPVHCGICGRAIMGGCVHTVGLKKRNTKMKVKSLDEWSSNGQVRLEDIGHYEHFQLPDGSPDAVYQKLACTTDGEKFNVRVITSGSNYRYDRSKWVYQLDCTMEVKRILNRG